MIGYVISPCCCLLDTSVFVCIWREHRLPSQKLWMGQLERDVDAKPLDSANILHAKIIVEATAHAGAPLAVGDLVAWRSDESVLEPTLVEEALEAAKAREGGFEPRAISSTGAAKQLAIGRGLPVFATAGALEWATGALGEVLIKKIWEIGNVALVAKASECQEVW
eukprot:CAMPEP_0170167726 /NCGR_PEP_ID=MMETSP0040_2-20121228/1045_1 /TAXON_ID=641309 /ORGANISM="Lotharella oceanica, Strain CCMP622" /LENGTH=165 /DNA_ID=CAMNT_0010405839 /DNA_START=218 /DNA_END=712 /DNA_ORIENTATION=-